MMTPDRIAASATGVGVGLAAFVVTWIVLNRLTALWLPVPEAPLVSLTSAILVGVGMALQRGTTLSRRMRVHTE